MDRHTLLKKLAVQATLFAGLVNLQGTRRPAPAPTASLHLAAHRWSQPMPPLPAAKLARLRGEDAVNRAFLRTLGAEGGTEAETTANTADLVALGFGSWPPPGLDTDPSLLRPRAAWNYASYRPGVDPAQEGGLTMAPVSVPPFLRDPFANVFPIVTPTYFSPAKIQLQLPPLDTPYHLREARSVEAHEGLHAVFAERQILLDLLFPDRDKGAPLSATKSHGLGPRLEALLASQETAGKTAARHQRFERELSGASNDTALAEYPLLYNELRSYLGQVVMDGVSSGRWDGLPRDKKELWAAVYATTGGTWFDPEERDEVSRFLGSPEGASTLRRFPALPLDIQERILTADLGKLSLPNRVRFYAEVLPEIYGEILEDLGDARGLAKMDLPPSPVHAMAFLHHLILDRPESPDAWKKKDWDAMAAKVEPETVQRLADLSQAFGRPEALESLMTLRQARLPAAPANRGLFTALSASFNETPRQEPSLPRREEGRAR
ncbi:MAG: hypothetical protein PW734_02990 [Verrucomicrobium sp.]|nr:hypothetical protein [Verrucomicrobium sp.]